MRHLLLVIVLLSGCRDAAYSAASKKDTVDEWRAFIRQHPDDENVPGARERLSELEFAEAQRTHTVLAYKRFLSEFNDTAKAPAAQALLEGLRFNAARERGTHQAWREFVVEHPDGAHRNEADAALSALELAQLTQLDEPRALSELAARHPDTAEASLASEKVDELAWRGIGSAASLFAYLHDFPAGRHRDEARTRLLSLELDSLLVSGEIEAARALALKSPLASSVAGLKTRFERAEAIAVLGKRDELVARALPAYVLRPFDEVVAALSAHDPLERWQAAEELGYFVSVRSLDPLLEHFRTARSSLIRQRCLESLRRVLLALPPESAEFAVASRLEALRPKAADTQLTLTVAVLLDLSGQLAKAAIEYQRAFDHAAPDPLVLRRWATIRLERRQFYSAAIAARQLAIHSAQAAAEVAIDVVNPLAPARELCALADEARFSVEVLESVSKEDTEFPSDVTAFLLRAREQLKLAEAKLHDAELALRSTDSRARLCLDDEVRARTAEGEQRRLTTLATLQRRPPPAFSLLLQVLIERDPSPTVRTAARAMQKTK